MNKKQAAAILIYLYFLFSWVIEGWEPSKFVHIFFFVADLFWWLVDFAGKYILTNLPNLPDFGEDVTPLCQWVRGIATLGWGVLAYGCDKGWFFNDD